MDAGNAIEVLDPYEWLPGYGESKVSLATSGLELSVRIEFDGAGGGTESRVLIFESTCSHTWSSFPGPGFSSIRYARQPAPPLGLLVEYPPVRGRRCVDAALRPDKSDEALQDCVLVGKRAARRIRLRISAYPRRVGLACTYQRSAGSQWAIRSGWASLRLTSSTSLKPPRVACWDAMRKHA
jgi:hypothetical protein